jgi:restriction endonuclease S subunit
MNETLLSERWEQAKVRELCDLSPGRAISPKKVDSRKGPYPVYGAPYKGGGITGYSNTYDHMGERITWVKYGPHAGATAYREGKFSCTYLLGTLKVKTDRVDAKYLRHALGYQAPNYASSTKIPRLTNSMILEIPVVLPPLPEQRIIAKLFDSIEIAVGTTENVIGMTVMVRDALLKRYLATEKQVLNPPLNERIEIERLLSSLGGHTEAFRKRKYYLKQVGKNIAWVLLTDKKRFHGNP